MVFAVSHLTAPVSPSTCGHKGLAEPLRIAATIRLLPAPLPLNPGSLRPFSIYTHKGWEYVAGSFTFWRLSITPDYCYVGLLGPQLELHQLLPIGTAMMLSRMGPFRKVIAVLRALNIIQRRPRSCRPQSCSILGRVVGTALPLASGLHYVLSQYIYGVSVIYPVFMHPLYIARQPISMFFIYLFLFFT